MRTQLLLGISEVGIVGHIRELGDRDDEHDNHRTVSATQMGLLVSGVDAFLPLHILLEALSWESKVPPPKLPPQ